MNARLQRRLDIINRRNLFATAAEEIDDSAGGGDAADRGDDIDFDTELGEEEEASTEEETGEEAKGEAEGEEGEDDAEPENRIPLSRFNQVNQKLKQTMAELEKIKQAQEAVQEKESGPSLDEQIDAALERQAVAIEEGDKAALKASTLELNNLQSQKLRTELLSETTKVSEKSTQEYEWKQAIVKVEADYPILNPDDPAYDDGKVDEVLDLQAGFEARGSTKAQALAKAIKYVFPSGPPKTETGATQKKGLGNKAKEAAKQPVSMDKAGEDADSRGDKASDVINMREDEFEALPESKKRSLRGDFM